VQRLVGRGTEDAGERARRLRTAKVELASQGEFDYRVVNDDVARAAEEVARLAR
jgi:guanylate kinase